MPGIGVMALNQRERGFELRNCLLVRIKGLRRFACANRVLDRFLDDAGLAKVMRQCSEMRREIGGVRLLERLTDNAM